MRTPLLLLPALALVACSAKPPEGAPPSRSPSEAALAAPPMPAPKTLTPPPDPREVALSLTVVHLLEEDHLLHKKIDDDVSRTAFDTYLERLDGGKMYLLRSDRDALARYADLIDDELHSGSLELAHAGEKVFVARVEMVDKMVSALLAAPMNHDDEEAIETDPKKIEPATTEDELRDRWRKRLELEVLERVNQMETRLAALAKEKDSKDKAGKDSKHGAAGAGSNAGSGSGSATGSSGDDEQALPAAEIPTTFEGREAKARADLAKTYAARFARRKHPGPLDAAAELINAVTSSLDPHTDYLPPSDKANFDIQMSGSLEGIGASLREHDHYIEVVELVPGGAAWREGSLATGDLILSVQAEGKEPVDVVDMKIDDVVKMIRGPKGTLVRLRVQKQGGHEQTIAITRDIVVIEEAYARGAVLQRKSGPAVGYIHLPAFYGGPNGQRTASVDVKRLLDELARRKVGGIVLDIRDNGGGLLNDAVKLTGEFIDQGPVVQVQDSSGKREVLSDDDRGVDYDGPVVVLIDHFSASASEILAGALQDYHRAVIVGTGTHGKGTVQTLADLDKISGSGDDLGVLKLTIEQFFRVSGSSTQLEGVTPDIPLPDPEGYLDTGERKLEHAIAWSSIAPARHDNWKQTWDIGRLTEHSATRVAKNPLLSKIAASNQVLRVRRSETKIPLQKAAYDAREKDLTAAIEAAAPDLVHAPSFFSVKTIEDPAAPATTPGPNGRQDDRPQHWRDALSRDPWVDECVSILGDMATK